MSMTLASLAARLQNDVPARNSYPSAEQYEQAVQDAAADYGQRAPTRQMAYVDVVSGTADYTLPADFVRLVAFAGMTGVDGLLISDEGLVPLRREGPSERYNIRGGVLTIVPTPAYTLRRELWYLAGHVLDEDEAFPHMGASDATTVLAKAESLVLSWQANKAAHEAWSYQIGDERVDKKGLADALRAQAQAAEARYQAALAGSGSRAYGTRSRYYAGR